MKELTHNMHDITLILFCLLEERVIGEETKTLPHGWMVRNSWRRICLEVLSILVLPPLSGVKSFQLCSVISFDFVETSTFSWW